jgi:uncharacterized membrane protein
MSQELNEGSEAIEKVKKDLANIQDIAQQDKNLLSDLPPEMVTSVSASRSEFFAGPLPPPSLLRAYEDILPGSADRILGMVEKQSDHRMSVESQWLKSEDQIRKQGSQFGLVVALVGMMGSIYLGAIGNTTASTVMSGGTLIGLVAVFVTGTKEKNEPPSDHQN